MRLNQHNYFAACRNRSGISTVVLAFFCICGAGFASRAYAQIAPEAKNIELVGHNNLNDEGDGGEGLAIQQKPDGRRILYLAHEGTRMCISVLDVTHPENPVLLNNIPSPAPGITRCDSLGLSGNVLVVADQTDKKGEKTAGMWVLDISDVDRVQHAKSMQDL